MMVTRIFYSLPKIQPRPSLQNNPREKKIRLAKPYRTEWNYMKKMPRPTVRER